jgi:hypothetical protein
MAECTFCKAETQLYANGVPVCVACDEKRAKPSDVRTTLVKAIEEATGRVDAANQAFNSVISDTPTGFPHPDGTQRIQNASQALKAARGDLLRAHHRLNEFLQSGNMPEDLKRSG